jgi:hypothetical protein
VRVYPRPATRKLLRMAEVDCCDETSPPEHHGAIDPEPGAARPARAGIFELAWGACV